MQWGQWKKSDSSNDAQEGDEMFIEYSDNKTEIIALIFTLESPVLYDTWDSSEAGWTRTPSH